MTYVWAYVAGTLTLINPCVLPLLPLIIAAAFQGSRLGPLMLALGLTLSFAVIGVGVTAFGHLVGIDDGLINRLAAVAMVLFGVVLLVPRGQALLARVASPLANRANIGIDRVQGAGAAGQLAVGVLLGAVWSPCVGPTLGGAIALAASGENLGQAGVTMLAFGIGGLYRAAGARVRIAGDPERSPRAADVLDAVGEAGNGSNAPRCWRFDLLPSRPDDREPAA